MTEQQQSKTGNLAGGALFLVLGVVVIVAASENPWLTSSGAIGPAAVPGTCGVLLALLGAAQAAFAIHARHRVTAAAQGGGAATIETAINTGDGVNRPPTPVLDDDAPAPGGEGSAKKALLTWGGVLVAALVFTVAGTLPTIGALTVYLLAVVARKRWLTTAIYTACLVAAVHVVFVMILKIPLPTGIWMG